MPVIKSPVKVASRAVNAKNPAKSPKRSIAKAGVSKVPKPMQPGDAEEALRELSLGSASTDQQAAEDVAATAAGSAPAQTGEVMVRYNHYKKTFKIAEGVLDWNDVNEEYALSFVFKGAFGRTVVNMQTEQPVVQEGNRYKGLKLGVEYRLDIEEDPTTIIAPSKPYVASSAGVTGRVLESSDGDGMFADKASCSCVYGNPCAVSYNCEDWNNRFDVAKRNGWKGFS
jgi:hypothetical protein